MKIFKCLKLICFGFLLIFLVACMAWIIVIRSNYIVPILMYHEITDEPKDNVKLAVSPEVFEKQMKFLRDNNYNIVYVYEIARMIKDKERIPAKTVAITFDDGREDNYLNAFPILKKYSIPATIFVIVDYLNRETWLNYDELKSMSLAGVDIGSHTLSHLWLSSVDDKARWKQEILGSKLALEEILGKKIKSFSYPGGDGARNQIIREIARESGYEVAVATSPGRGFPNDDIYALKRVRISNSAKNLFVFWFQASGYYRFLKEKQEKY